jgi:hypothetical protein
MVKASPHRAMMDSITVQDRRVCFSSIPKYLLTSQNPLSLTCDSRVAPEAMDMTIRASSGGTGSYEAQDGCHDARGRDHGHRGRSLGDPYNGCQHPGQEYGGMAESEMELAIISPMPLSTRICFSTPPAPVTRMMMPAGPSALVLRSSSSCLDLPRRIPRKYMASRAAMIRH